jgi:hypothetical protein
MIRFTAQSVSIDAAAGEDEQPSRQISGIAVPYNVDAVVMGGQKVRVLPGAIPTDGPAPRLLAEHDHTRVVGMVTARESDEAGMLFTAKIAATQAGDDLLELIKMGAYDSVSVGLQPIEVEQDGRTTVVKAAAWEELSVVYAPAFADAKITEIAASSEADDSPEPEPQPSEEDTDMEDQTPEVVEAAASAVVASPPVYAKPKKLTLPALSDYIEAAREGGSRWHLLNEQIQAATGDVVVSDAAGLVPTPVVTPYYDDIQPLRPIVNALGARSMPAAGSTFLRPKVANHASVAAQSSELATVSTADFDLSNVTFTKKTFAGTLYISEQVIDFSTPSMLEAAVTDLATKYALATEDYVVDQLAAAITNTQEVQISDFTDDTEVITDLYTAAASIASTGNYFPNALVMAPTMWVKLGAVSDGNGRPLFPQSSPSNGIGTLPQGVTGTTGNPLGLNLIVSNQIGTQAVGNKDANEYWWLMNTRGVECYEQYKGFIQVTNAAQLGVQVTVRGYFAAEVIDVNMIRILGPDATFS